jgi:tetratricopeptide (TPR) repeat protein
VPAPASAAQGSSCHEQLQRLLYREFLAERDLYKEVGLERLPISLSALLGWPADEVIWRLAETTFLEELSLEQLAKLFRIHDMELVSQTAATVSRKLKLDDVDYDSAIRAGLAYAASGMHAHAFAALRAAARKRPQWARHHYLYGILAGLTGNHDRAVRELERALEQEPYEDAKQRVRAAIELLEPMRQHFPGY